jgi:glutamate/tyrosine decarboxylase-like PLP-dependent enzyme
LAELDERQHRDPDFHGNHLFGLVYPTGRDDIEALIRAVYERYLFSNALNPLKFHEISIMEQEVVSAAATLTHHSPSPSSTGAITSGGTESILMSLMVNRERARSRGVEHPQILAPESAHPAYAKAAHYFDMELVQIPLDEQYRADVAAARALVTDRTAVVVASAYSYPHGAMDPVTELAALAHEGGFGCHVDACIGGFVLPFMEMNGREVPPWDFRVPGVTQISMDVHKYGYVPKGASVLVHRDDDWSWVQTFFYEKWGSGLYATPAIIGARSAAPTVATWAMLQYLGIDGYCDITRDLMTTTDHLREGINDIAELELVGTPIGTVLALCSSQLDLRGVGAAMDQRGWHLNRNSQPRGLHLMVSPAHAGVADQFLADLREAVANPAVSDHAPVRYA